MALKLALRTTNCLEEVTVGRCVRNGGCEGRKNKIKVNKKKRKDVCVMVINVRIK